MKRTILSILLTLSVMIFPVLAADDTVDGTVSVGLNITDGNDSMNQTAEYKTNNEDGTAEISVDLFAGNEDRYVIIQSDIVDKDDVFTKILFQLNPGIRDTFTFNRYLHRLDHDYMDNLQARESMDAANNTPGGKMITNEDHDPYGEYGIVVTDLQNNLEVDLGEHVMIDWGFRNMAREGFEQSQSVEHCSMCHINARKTRVDEETRDHTLGVHVALSKINIVYRYMISEFHNYVDAPTNYYRAAVHPTTGEKGVEFAPRTNFQDQEMPYSATPENSKTAHDLKFTSDLTSSNAIMGRFSVTNVENESEGLEMDTTYGAFKWMYRPEGKFYMTALVSRESIDNDSVYIDLPTWREGRTGGGQDFDWTRESAFNRDVTIANMRARYNLSKSQYLSFDYRYRSIDREYLEIDHDTTETETAQHRVTAAWSYRSQKSRSNVSLVYEISDQPFANREAMCEKSLYDTPALPDNSFVYYFQRERQGEGSNLPSDSLKLNANFSMFKTSKFSVNFQGTYQDEKNDELNSYEWERDQMTLGFNIFVTASTKAAFAAGYNYLDISSNASFCVPVMDG